jgi:hypothetical protein
MAVALTVYGGSGSGAYEDYSYVNIAANVPTGYHFVSWGSLSNVIVDNIYSASTFLQIDGHYMASTASVGADWEINTYTIQYNAGSHGSITGNSTQAIDYGGNGDTVTAVPDSGYRFVQWDDGVLTTSRHEHNVISSHTYTASFALSDPTVTYVGPSTGTAAGDTHVTLIGTNFTGATAVHFGTTDAASFSVTNDTHISCWTPAHAVGVVNVSVTTPSGTGTKTNGFTFTGAVKSVAGAITPTGTLHASAGHHITGLVTSSGVLSTSHGSAGKMGIAGAMAPTGELFIYKLRPFTLKAPYVLTTFGAPK